LDLELDVRQNFWYKPFAVILGALVIALIVGWVSTRLGNPLTSLRMRALLAGNGAASPARKLNGLDKEWVKNACRTTSKQSVLNALIDVKRNGPSQAAVLRHGLEQHAARSVLPEHHPLREAAEQTASDTTLRLQDFLDEDAHPVEHPAVLAGRRLSAGETLLARIDGVQASLASLAGPQLHTELERVRQSLADASTDDQLGVVRSKVDALELDALRAPPAGVTSEQQGSGVSGLPSGLGAMVRPALFMPAVEAKSTLASATILPTGDSAAVASRGTRVAVVGLNLLADLVVLLAIFLLIAVAAFSVASATYFTNSTFGSTSDYVRLVASGLGSGVATGVVALAVLLRPASR
jgi:hypothetical protein